MPVPWNAFRQLAGLPRPMFFDSAMPHVLLGRYSFITADPFEWIASRGQHIVTGTHRLRGTDPFRVLEDTLRLYRSEAVPGLPPFQGGAAGLFGYDLCHHLEKLPRPRWDEFESPDLAIGLYDWVIAFDLMERRAWLISTGFPETEPHQRLRRAAKRRAEIRRLLAGNSPAAPPHRRLYSDRGLDSSQLTPEWPVPDVPGLLSNFERNAFLATVRRAIEYIHAGDCFQVNLSQRLLVRAPACPLELYGRLRTRNAAPFAGYFDLGDFVLASASPERFVRVDRGEVETRPIKGTRPRGRTPDEDAQHVAELLASSKDRAENVMIVDLLRNDLGRVCAYGSVRVPAVCRLESYGFVHHLVSEVRGRLRPERGPVDLLRAAFPGGSVTGAPKIRAMEIIAELEPTARGPYCGSVGYVGFDGSMDSNILIRTAVAGRGWLQFSVGGGIVADSIPDQEYEETWHKATGLLRALE
jgi:para-aminobenzoate synthetase component 1